MAATRPEHTTAVHFGMDNISEDYRGASRSGALAADAGEKARGVPRYR